MRNVLKKNSLIQIYECLCDETRLRILNLLRDGPLCVSHLQEIMNESQVKISKHLRYLKAKSLVEAKRSANMMIYHLPIEGNPHLEVNLVCLRECVKTIPIFIKDKEKLYQLLAKNDWLTNISTSRGMARSKSLQPAMKAGAPKLRSVKLAK
jgi:ArsR family transcriptional regulator, arsenate/arsenite/antimonite-responsive transcriptional repressor